MLRITPEAEMTLTPGQVIEALIRSVSEAGDLPLGDRLRRLSEAYREMSPAYVAAVDGLVARLEAAGAGEGGPAVGESMPDFIMPDQDGRLVRLSDLAKAGPVVLVFHRAHWCPYCRISMSALAEVQDRAGSARIVAVSAETEAYTRTLRDEAGADFAFLTDVGAGYALSLGLAIWLGDELAGIHARAGRDVPAYQGGGGWVLPIPSVFVIGADMRVAVRHVDPDYRRRMDLDELLDALRRLEAARPVR